MNDTGAATGGTENAQSITFIPRRHAKPPEWCCPWFRIPAWFQPNNSRVLVEILGSFVDPMHTRYPFCKCEQRNVFFLCGGGWILYIVCNESGRPIPVAKLIKLLIWITCWNYPKTCHSDASTSIWSSCQIDYFFFKSDHRLFIDSSILHRNSNGSI